jgi:hypothetical protein
MGIDVKDSERLLKELFKLLEKEGLTVNKDKCIFNASEVIFFDFEISTKGVSLKFNKRILTLWRLVKLGVFRACRTKASQRNLGF